MDVPLSGLRRPVACFRVDAERVLYRTDSLKYLASVPRTIDEVAEFCLDDLLHLATFHVSNSRERGENIPLSQSRTYLR
jgi:hypothetical protein